MDGEKKVKLALKILAIINEMEMKQEKIYIKIRFIFYTAATLHMLLE